MSDIKKCSTCKILLPLSDEYFHKSKATKSGYGARCKICVSRANKLYKEENKADIAKKRKPYQQQNRESLNDYQRRYVNDNRKAITEYKKLYVQENKEVHRQYQRDHLEECRAYNQKRRSAKRLLPSTLTIEQWQNAAQHFNNACSYCGKNSTLEQEHFQAVSNGGEYSVSNIIPACGSCNKSKKASDPLVWYPKQSFYNKGREDKILKYLGICG